MRIIVSLMFLLFFSCLLTVLNKDNKLSAKTVATKMVLNVPDPLPYDAEVEEKETEEENKEVTGNVMDEVFIIIVHHSDTLKGDVESFRHYHTKVRGWVDVAYHYVIPTTAEVQVGRLESVQGAHAKYRNENSIGVCLVGKTNFTDEQIDALVNLLVDICRRHSIVPSMETIQRHHEECPGAGLNLHDVIRRVEAMLAV